MHNILCLGMLSRSIHVINMRQHSFLHGTIFYHIGILYFPFKNIYYVCMSICCVYVQGRPEYVRSLGPGVRRL